MKTTRQKRTNKKQRVRTTAPAPRAITACVLAALAQCAVANPTGHQVAAGSATVQASGKTLKITNTPGTILNWQSFSIAPGELTKFVQQSAASAVMNRVIAANPSSIMGTLQSNGRVFLVNPHGIVIGAGALIDTAGFVASTLNIADKDFLAGKLKFEGGGAGVLRNEGTIQAARDIFLVGPKVENAGIIRSAAGDVVLAAGKSITITSPDAHGVQFGIQAPDDSVVNLGTIQAANAVGLFAGTLKHSGEIKVTSASLDSAGRVVLSAQKDTILDGNSKISVDNSVGRGGSVQVLGERVGLFDHASISATGAAGGGEILVGGDYRGLNPDVRNAFITWFGPDARLDASATASGSGGRVIVWADDTTRARGHIAVRGGIAAGSGGFVETSGKRFLAATRAPDTSAPKGNPGEWLLDPDTVIVDTACPPGPGCSGTNESGPAGNEQFSPGGNNSLLLIGTLQARVNDGGTVTIDTSSGGAGAGDITFNVLADFAPTAPAVLNLRANRNISLSQGLRKAGAGSLEVNFVPNEEGAQPTATASITNGITSNGGLTLNGTVNIMGGPLFAATDPGALVESFAVKAGATATLVTTNQARVTLAEGHTIDVDGTLALTGLDQTFPANTLRGRNNAVLNIRNGGLFNLQIDRSLEFDASAVATTAPHLSIQAGGEFRKSGTGPGAATQSDINWRMTNAGTVAVTAGTLRIDPLAGVTSVSTGTLRVSDGTTLDLNHTTGGIHQLGDGAVLSRAPASSTGAFAYTGNNLQATGSGTGATLANGAELDLTGKTLGGSGKFTNLGELTFNDTAVTGSLTNGATGLLDISGAPPIFSQIDLGLTLLAGSTTRFEDGTQLNLGGANPLTWQGGNIVDLGGGGLFTLTTNGGTFTVSTGSAHNLDAGITIDNSLGTTVIDAAATLTKNAGVLNAGAVNNNGTFRLTVGTQTFAGGGNSNGGIFTADGGTTINFTGGTAYNLTGAATRLNGPGNFGVGAGATFNVTDGSSDVAIGTFTNQGTTALTTTTLSGAFSNQGAASILDLNASTLTGAATNQGAINAGMGANQIDGGITSGGAGSTIDIAAGASLTTNAFTWQDGTTIGPGTGMFTVAGAFTMPGVPAEPERVVDGPTLNVTGAATLPAGRILRIQNGQANFSGAGSTYAGTLTVDAGRTINFTGGDHTFNAGAALGGMGTILNSGATSVINVNGDTTATVTLLKQTAGTLNLAGGMLTKDGGTFEITGGQVNGPNTLAMTNGAMFASSGAGNKTLNNLVVNALSVDASGGTLIVQDTSLTAGGLVTVDAGAAIQIDNTSVLTANAGGANDGGITMNAGMFTINNVAFSNNSNTSLILNGGAFTANAVLNNPGTITVAGAGASFTTTAAFNNTGTFTLTDGTTSLQGGGTHTNGTFNVAGGETLNFSGGAHLLDNTALNGPGAYRLIAGSLHAVMATTSTRAGGVLGMSGNTLFDGAGTLNIANDASFELTNPGIKNLNGVTITNAGPTNVLAGTLQISSGAFNATNTVTVSPNSSIFVAGGGFTVTPTTTVDVNALASFQVNAGTVNLRGGGTQRGVVQAIGAGTIEFGGGTHNLDGAQLNGTGTIVQSGGILRVMTNDVTSNVNLFQLTGGELSIDAGRSFTKTAGTFEFQAGTIGGTGNLLGQNAMLTLPGAGARFFNGPTATVDALNLAGGTLTMQSGTVTVVGTTNVAQGTQLALLGGAATQLNTQGAFNISGQVINQATINNQVAIDVMANGVFSGGGGTVTGDLGNSAGTVSPGASPGHMIIQGNYTQLANGTLVIDLEGTQQGVTYDWLEILGTANLNGTLRVRLGGGFLPGPNDIFNFMTYANRFGNFTNFDLPPGFVLPTAGPLGYSVSSGIGAAAGATESTNTASADVVALQEQKTSGEAVEQVEEDDKNKEKGAICT